MEMRAARGARLGTFAPQHNILLRTCTGRAVVIKIIARRRVGEFRNKVIYSERQLYISREVGICNRAYICRASGICSDGFRAGLRVRSQHCAKRPFKFKLREKRYDALFYCGVVGDGLSDVSSWNFLGFNYAERREKDETPVVHLAAAHL